MFATNESNNVKIDNEKKTKKNKKNATETNDNTSSETNVEVNINALLEKEKQHNKTESWNKLDKTIKIQKLHSFAEKYGKDNGFSMKDIKSLKIFFKDCLEKNKLQKTKEVLYNKESQEITKIPALFFNHTNRNFTLKIIDTNRVSTLKSLTPLRNTSEKSVENL